MPTYVCTTSPGRLTSSQKQSMVHHLTAIHSTEASAPRFVVRVIFNEIPPGNQFINEIPVTDDEIWIRADIRAGRTEEQKESLCQSIIEMVGKVVGVDRSYVWVYISDLAKAAEFGSVMPAPGQEAAWVDAIPNDVKKRHNIKQ